MRGADIIADFGVGDTLLIARNINGTDISSPADISARIASVGNDSVIDLGDGNSVTLVDVSKDDLVAHIDSFVRIL